MTTASTGVARRSLIFAGAAPATAAAGPDWRDTRWLTEFPQLTLRERDRRLAWMRALMEREFVEALVFSTRPGHDQLSHYVTNDGSAVVVLPLRSEPVAFVFGPLSARGAAAKASAEARIGPGWIRDWRFGASHEDVVALLQQRGLAGARLGTVGRDTSPPIGSYMERGGRPWSLHRLWRDLGVGLPAAEWVDLFWSFAAEASVKSDEEMAQFKKAALLAELGTRAFIDTVRPGATLAEAQLAAAEVVVRHGGHTTTASGAFENTRRLNAGDSVNQELVAYVGDIEAQAGYTVCLGPPSASMQALIDACDRSYRIGLANCRPGVTLRELEAAMKAPFADAGAWHPAPLYHGLSPIVLQGTTGREILVDQPWLKERFFRDEPLPYSQQFGGDFVLREGMLLHLEPNARRGRDHVFLGVNVRITRDGHELYSDSGAKVHVKT